MFVAAAGAPGARMLIDHGMSLHCVSGRVMRAGIRLLRVSECARECAHACVCVSPGGYVGEGRIFRARILEVQGSETGEWGS